MSKKVSIAAGLVLIAFIAILFYLSWNMNDDVQLAGKTKVRLQLQWFDQAQFIGFYVADEKGFYSEEGIELSIVPGGYNINPIMKVRMGEAEIGLATADQLLLQKAEGQDVVAFGNVYDKSIACFISRKGHNIQNPQDLEGKKVGVYRGYDTENVLLSMLDKHGVDPESVNIVDAGSFSAFVSSEIDVFPSYIINEPLLAKENDISINVMLPDDFGVQFYSDTLFSTSGYFEKNQDIVNRFLVASEKGWEYARQYPDEALEIMYRSVRSSGAKLSSGDHQKEMLSVVLDNINEDGSRGVFHMDRERWLSMEKSLFDIGKLKNRGHVKDLCRFKFVENIK